MLRAACELADEFVQAGVERGRLAAAGRTGHENRAGRFDQQHAQDDDESRRAAATAARSRYSSLLLNSRTTARSPCSVGNVLTRTSAAGVGLRGCGLPAARRCDRSTARPAPSAARSTLAATPGGNVPNGASTPSTRQRSSRPSGVGCKCRSLAPRSPAASSISTKRVAYSASAGSSDASAPASWSYNSKHLGSMVCRSSQHKCRGRAGFSSLEGRMPKTSQIGQSPTVSNQLCQM